MTIKHVGFTRALSAFRGALALTAVAACSSDHAPPDVGEPAPGLDPAGAASLIGPAEIWKERVSDLPIYRNRRYSPEERAADLVSRMTLAEKASQMISSRAPAIPALGIPAYGWWNEAAHGVAREQVNDRGNPPNTINTTSYPVDLSLGSTWNPELMYREARMISDEAREVFSDNKLNLNFYAPTINLARDPRWGRNDEAFSEDPVLTAAISAQFVNGMEGKDQRGRLLVDSGGYLKVNTTLKHYAANNSEFNRRNGTSDMDERTLREYYTAQFRDVIRAARPASIMSAYNRVNGVPVAASIQLKEVLARSTFGFRGFFTSDCDAIREIQSGHRWQPPGYPHPLDAYERHAFAAVAGEDLNCNWGYHDSYSYANTLVEAVAREIPTPTGTFNENDVDPLVTRLFAARIRLGEFDDDARVPWVTRARARVPQGTWTNSDDNGAITQTPERLAMAREVGAEAIVLLKNSETRRKDGSTGTLLPLRVPASGAFRLAVIGTYANPAEVFLGGYSSDQGPAGHANTVSGYSGVRAAVQAINPAAVVDFYPGVTPGTLTEVDAASVAAAADYDAVVVYVGTDERHSREDVDRRTLDLPGAQAELIRQVAAQNPSTIVYMETVGQMEVGGFEPDVAALLWSSYNGQRKGEALADVLLGAQNPSGRLPFTWYTNLSDLPPIDDYAIRPTEGSRGRTYMYFEGPVTYPFGHGLSYTRFEYSDLQTDQQEVDANGTLRVSVSVSNAGSVAGQEVVQLYVSTPDAPAALERPRKRLRAFQKIALGPQESRTVRFDLRIADLAFFDEAQGRYTVDAGTYGVQIARSAADQDVAQQALVTVTGALRAVPAVVTAKPQIVGDHDLGIQQRVFFPVGAEIDPQLTVSLSDETLHGYITKGASGPLPEGMRVSFESNRPRVVSVDGDGAIRTIAPGVATVTASVEYRGVTAKVDFVIYVRST
ncbi:glycoside hydrolase family 3 C-terminal domain-containing protein [Sorangium sp. So ce1335]|uniref:glycoside hydrolase family 3 C-terminal domain-containing protein n=1 Tax=Sorangium sp. So ce1335 TaxID=3133335 RepID=UPI003F5F8BF2